MRPRGRIPAGGTSSRDGGDGTATVTPSRCFMSHNPRVDRVDIVIVSYCSASELGACIGSARTAFGSGRAVVVDNASTDGSLAVARAAGAHEVVENAANLGFAAAVNRGLRHTDTRRVLLLNPDARLESHTLLRLVAALDREPQAAVAAPLLVDGSGRVTTGCGPVATAARRAGLCVPGLGRAGAFRPRYQPPSAGPRVPLVRRVDYAFGAVMLLDRNPVEAVGGFDERFFLFAEDEDLCRQLRASGREIVLDAGAVAQHEGAASSTDGALTEAQRLYSTWLLLEKWDGRRAARVYRRGVLAAFTARSLVAMARRRPHLDQDEIVRTADAFDQAVRSGRDPLLAAVPHDAD